MGWGGRSLAAVMCGAGLIGSAVPGLGQDGRIPYEQVLASPDDLSLSYAFARQAADAGRLEQAAGALERILLIEPDFDTARLFYAFVLYRLDDMEGAARELRLLQSRSLTPEQQREVAHYLALSEKRARPTRVTAATSVGVAHDTNPTLISRSEAGLSAGFDVPLDRTKESSAAAIAAADLRIEHELGTGRGDLLFLETRGWLKEYFEAESADYAIGRLEAGGTFNAGDLALTPRGIFSASLLDGDRFLTEAGGGLGFRYVVTPRFALLADILALQQDFAALDDGAARAALLPRDGRDGLKLRAAGGLSARLSQRDTLTLQAAYVDKDAEHAAFSYDGLEVNLNHLTLLGRGQYLMADLWYWRYDFDAPDPRYSPTLAHEDDRYRIRVSYGLPLDTLIASLVDGPPLPAGLRDINLQLSAVYYRQDSTIPNLDFDNFSGEALLTKRFTF